MKFMKSVIALAFLLLISGCVSLPNGGNDFAKGLSAWKSTIQSYGASESNIYPGTRSNQETLLEEMKILENQYSSKQSPEAKAFVQWIQLYEKGLTVQIDMRESQQFLIASNRVVDCNPGSEFSKSLELWKQARSAAQEIESDLQSFNDPKFQSMVSPYWDQLKSTNASQLPLLKENEKQLAALCA